MGYRLRSGLSKTMVHQVVSQHVPEDFVLPTLRKCDFKSYRNTYWLRFFDDDYSYEAILSVYWGGVHVRLSRGSYPDDESGIVWSRISFDKVPSEYLLAHQMLREVS